MKTYTENLTMKRLLTTVFALLTLHASFAADVLVEAESFADKGGWAVDQQFMDLMGSPYLIAQLDFALAQGRGSRQLPRGR